MKKSEEVENLGSYSITQIKGGTLSQGRKEGTIDQLTTMKSLLVV